MGGGGGGGGVWGGDVHHKSVVVARWPGGPVELSFACTFASATMWKYCYYSQLAAYVESILWVLGNTVIIGPWFLFELYSSEESNSQTVGSHRVHIMIWEGQFPFIWRLLVVMLGLGLVLRGGGGGGGGAAVTVLYLKQEQICSGSPPPLEVKVLPLLNTLVFGIFQTMWSVARCSWCEMS